MSSFMRSRTWTLLLANAVVVASYLFIGQLSGWLALPRAYATPLFPPAGVALALTVTFGWPVLPGVALGALLLHLQASWTGLHAHRELSLWVALAVTAGSVAEVAIGAALFRRWIDPALGSGRDVLRFLLLAAGVCLISASVAVGALSALDLLAPGERAASWLIWWAGDTIGMLLAAPLCWIAVGQPRALWRHRFALVALPLILAVAAVVATYQQARRWEHDQGLQAFRLKSQQVSDLLQAQFSEHERFIYALARALNDTGRLLPQDDFSSIAMGYLDRRPELTAVNWIVRVSQAQRPGFEAWARRHVDPTYRIREPAPDGSLRPAGPRAEYYPLLYTEPAANRMLLGLDFRSEPVRAAALARAWRASGPLASAPLRLLRNGHPGIALFESVRAQPGATEPIGMLGIVLEIDSYLERAIGQANVSGLRAELTDVTDPARPLPVLAGIDGLPQADDYRKVLSFGKRSYLLRLAPTPQYMQQQRGWQSWSVLSGGLLLTGLLVSLMLLISGERAQIQAQVEQSTAMLREREARLQAILDNAAEAILTVAYDGTLKSGNAAAGRLFGYPPEQLPGLRLERLLPIPAGLDATAMLLHLAHAQARERELTGLTSDGQTIPLAVSVSRVALPDETLFVCILRDLTEQRRSQQFIYQLAHHDALTGLENRLSLNLRLEHLLTHARRQQEPVAVLFVDLDHFKKINDSYGHQTGDLLLIAVACRMKELLRDADAIARLGGDEFIIVMAGPLTPELVSAVAVRLVQSLAAPYHLDGTVVHSGASVGVAMYPADGADAGTLLRHADTAMYAAKSAGRGNFQFFSPAMNAATHERLMLENRLWLALERKQFELHLQPQVELSSGRVIGAEALLRWHDLELGTVEPSRFIPIAEECGLILPLGDWVLERAIEMLSEWRREGMGSLRLAVNLSARQCHGNALIVHLDQLLAHSRVDPALLELEITETAAMRDPENTRHLLRQLRQRGITVAIDDFGTGYSSLSYLKLFAIDRIKIDRAFVKDIETDPNDAAIVAATIGLAHALGLRVVAEGVETGAQQDFLRDNLGDEAQGFLFARPMPAAEFGAFVRALVQPEPGLSAP
jgi:diguanylate cyclase (GGDEF)-like protein/PAS domain S-box-containing protein